MQALYTATATAVGGRNGAIKSSDGVLDLRLAYPKELGSPGGAATNPEQLFAAGLRLASRMRFCGWRESASDPWRI